MRQFALGLIADRQAIEAALTLPWSNGQTEGQVNRLKVLKREMYGRAKIEPPANVGQTRTTTQHKETTTRFTSNWTSSTFFAVPGVNHQICGRAHLAECHRSERKVLRKYAAYDCLVIDELGYVEVEPSQVALFFTLMQKRHQTKTTLLTSNLGFSEWDSFLRNKQLTAALADRLTSSSHVINMRHCHSLRGKLDAGEDRDVK
jgi:hypothetical protein